MKLNLFLLTAASFFMLAPMVPISGLESPPNPVVTQPEHMQMGQHKQISDNDLKATIKRSVSHDPELSKLMDDVDIKVDKGVITLSGKVKSEIDKAKIVSKIKAIGGEHQIVNKIEVKK